MINEQEELIRRLNKEINRNVGKVNRLKKKIQNLEEENQYFDQKERPKLQL